MKDLLIIGAGGHGRVVADIAGRTGRYGSVAFLDDMPPKAGFGYAWLGKTDRAGELLDRYELFVAIGNGAVRRRLMEELTAQGAVFATLTAPEAVIAGDVKIGEGSVVMPGAVINTGTMIGRGVIVNTASSVDHDCCVADYCHVAVGARLCGTVHVGEQTWIGAGATIINNITVCPGCMIGAGAVVVKQITQAGTYLGVPAKRVNGK